MQDDDYDPELHTDDSVEDEWDVLVRCWDQLRHVCLAVSRGDEDEADEMMGEVVDRMPAIVECWDPTRGVPLRAYVFRTVRLYMRKRIQVHARRKSKLTALDTDNHAHDPPAPIEAEDPLAETWSFDEIEHMVRSVDEECADVLRARYRNNESYAEIASEHRVSMRCASRMCARAYEMARRLVKERLEAEQRARDEMRRSDAVKNSKADR